ncbi:aspartyl-phosphate phosphatase Spo0E family protein [Desulfosporosinus sp. PR]|uniref:aspartyl-phosphate phosphatase Spo0E family protein n=1 Tax=Candidatus Desulfosporosinus nitrosoreducens TaxID=3401928 RepID=UPI0027F46E86|nr:aspartyl-phosphate phosphatase Spo0E family protein [Desulfosporosinus sp. PR]MDQ7092888.1 aspartyl-phosphate phosphatase Spo0E family protein [Desulfosporosinus sp. PR]
MSELAKIIGQIEELRLSTIKVQGDNSSADPETVAACHELHTALDRYQGILMRVKEDK